MGNNKNPTSYFYIKKLTIGQNTEGRNITFVDFNTGPFVCLHWVKNEAEYNDPKKCMFDQYYMDRWTYKKTTDYYLALLEVVSQLDRNNWNVMRGHHPPSNYEDGDATFYWDVEINGQTYNLMEKFEEKNVRVFLGSHIHGQSVMTVPFRKTKMRERGKDKVSAKKDGSFCNQHNLKANSEELMNVESFCNTDKFSVDLDSEKLMIIFINGNSGRKFDDISNGGRSERGNTVWAKNSHIKVDGKEKEAFGFSFAEFQKDNLFFQFHEMNDKNNEINTDVVSTFIVNFDDGITYKTNTLEIVIIVLMIFTLILLIGYGVSWWQEKKRKAAEKSPLDQELQ